MTIRKEERRKRGERVRHEMKGEEVVNKVRERMGEE